MIERLFERKRERMSESGDAQCLVATLVMSVGFSLVVGCTEPTGDSVAPGPPVIRAIVLESAARGYRMLDLDSAGIPASILRIELPVGFSGSAFDVRATRAIATTGGQVGNDAYVTDLSTGTTEVVALPQATDDPGAARFLSEDTALVTARGTGRIYRFRVSSSGFEAVSGDIAQFPVDVVPFEGSLYVIDANADRGGSGATLGASRVIVLDAGTGAVLDTVVLGGESAQRGAIVGSRLFVLQTAGPLADPAGRLSALDVGGGAPVLLDELDLEGLGRWLETGLDGLLYVTVAPNPASADSTHVLVVDPATVGFVAGPDDPLALARPNGTPAACQAAVADERGSIYCIERSSTGGFLYVYGADLQGRTAISLGAGVSDLVIAAIP
jgi:hypothetical protein